MKKWSDEQEILFQNEYITVMLDAITMINNGTVIFILNTKCTSEYEIVRVEFKDDDSEPSKSIKASDEFIKQMLLCNEDYLRNAISSEDENNLLETTLFPGNNYATMGLLFFLNDYDSEINNSLNFVFYAKSTRRVLFEIKIKETVNRVTKEYEFVVEDHNYTYS